MRICTRRDHLFFPWVALGLVLGWLPLPVDAQTSDSLYVVTNVGAFESGGMSKGYGINNFGQVVGNAPDTTGEDKPRCWHWQNGELVDINSTIHFRNLFTMETGEAYDVSDADQIVGGGWFELKVEWREEPLEVIQAFVTRPAVLSDFGTPYPGDAVTVLGGFTDNYEFNSVATAISNNNHVVGWANISDGTLVGVIDEYHFHNNFHAFLVRPAQNGDGWYRQGVVMLADGTAATGNTLMVDLGVLRGVDQISSATDVNDDGLVVGYSYGDEVGYEAFVIEPVGEVWANLDASFVNDMMESLGTLGGTNSWARGTNNDGQIVGDADTADFDTRAFVVTPQVEGGVTTYFVDADSDGVNDLMTDLGTLGGANSAAMSINDQGVICGWAEDANRDKHACIWIDGEIYDLNDLLILTKQWTLVEARDINESGQITGWGRYSGGGDGQLQAFVLDIATADDIAKLPPEEDEDPNDPDAGSTGGSGGGTSSTGGSLDLPDVVSSGSGASDDTTTAPVSSPGALCGMGLMNVLPLLLAGLLGMKTHYRRR